MSRGRNQFTVKRTEFLLRFEGADFEGLEIRATSLPLGQFFEFQRLQQEAGSDLAAAEKIIEKLAGVISSWNLEDEDGEPVGCNIDGLRSLELPFVLRILHAWMEAVAAVPNLSKSPSNNGATSLELSMPMDDS